MEKLKVLDLFSGIGGFSLGLERTGGFETVAFCEIEEFPRKVLKKHWPDVPVFEDVRKLKGSDVGPIDIICGGYPCQPFSTAGKRLGQKDDRHLWPEFNRLAAELRPTWVIGENVAGHISMGLDDVLSDLEGQGYACRTFVIPACAVGAHHRRDRCWTIGQAPSLVNSSSERTRRAPQKRKSSCALQASEGVEQGWNPLVAHTQSERHREAGQSSCGRSKRFAGASSASEDVANAERFRCNKVVPPIESGKIGQRVAGSLDNGSGTEWWARWLPEPDVGRVADGVPNRVDRLRALGNAVVPQIPEMIGRAILEARA